MKLRRLAKSVSDVGREATYSLNARTNQNACHVPCVHNLDITNHNAPAVSLVLSLFLSRCCNSLTKYQSHVLLRRVLYVLLLMLP